MSINNVIDLNAAAAKREAKFPEGFKVPYGSEEFILPAELPMECLDPFFNMDIDLASILAQAVQLQFSGDEDQAAKGQEAMWQVLLASPNLPKEVWQAIRVSLVVLFGEEQWDRFIAQRPSVSTYVALIIGVVKMYGAALGEAFGSATPSETGGQTSSETSPSSTKSTRGGSGKTRAQKASLESAAS